MRRHGMTAEEWDVIRATPTIEADGARFFAVDELMRREDLPTGQREALAARVQGIITEEMMHAVPEPDALARVVTTGFGAQRGTLMGELGRSVLQFKSFPIAVISLHVQRAVHAAALRSPGSAAAYAAALIIGTTTFGYLAMQAKQIARGKDPRDPALPETWAAAFTQGGGAGIYGDFLFNDVNRFGRGPVRTMMGPTVDLVEDATRVSLGNVQELMQGEDPELGADVVGFASRYMPGGSLWYSRLVLERAIFDQLALEADPRGARGRFNRAERRAREEGSGYWWRPGRRLPSRAPEVESLE